MNELEDKFRSINLRRAWAQKKFGQCSGKPVGCEQGITQEDLRSLQVTWYIPGLGRTTSLDIFGRSTTKKQEAKQTPQRKTHIKCRYCRGCHLTAKCPNRFGAVAPAVAPVKVERAPQTYYLGPPPGIESNPLDFDLNDTEQQQKTEEISATVQSYVQVKQVEEVTKLLNQIMNNKHTKYSNRGTRHVQAATTLHRVSPPMLTRKMNSLNRRVKNHADSRWDFRKRTIPTPGSSVVRV